MTTIWRPKLFSALGAGFQTDDTLNDGVHLRWMFDPVLGLPLQREKNKTGGFQVYGLIVKYPCLQEMELKKWLNHRHMPVNCDQETLDDVALHQDGQSLYFLRLPEPQTNLAVQKIQNQLRHLRSWRLKPDHNHYLHYLRSVTQSLMSELVSIDVMPPPPRFERGEVCAIDMEFSIGEGTNQTGETPENNGCLGLFVSPFLDRPYAWVRAYDRDNNLLQQDWVGRYGSTIKKGRRIFRKNKLKIRFRIPGIHRIAVVPVRFRPVLNRDSTCWIFCEDYCNAPIWEPLRDAPVCFNPLKQAYSEEILKHHYYQPFKKELDWSVAHGTWVTQFLDTPQMRSLVASQNTYAMYTNAVALEDNAPDGSISQPSLPMLSALLQTAIDPAVAHLLGLYGHVDPQFSKRDIKIEADMPFFRQGNLAQLSQALEEIVEFQKLPFSLDELLGLGDPDGKSPLRLGGLVLCPTVTPKPVLKALEPITTQVTVADLPKENAPDETVLMIDSALSMPDLPFAIQPYKTVQCLELERRLDSGDFESVTDDEPVDALQELAILPPVIIPTRSSTTNILAVRDDFLLSEVTTDLLQYRLRAFDIFARPGQWSTGNEKAIPIPCRPPEPVSIVSVNLDTHDDHLWAELMLVIDGTRLDLQARSTQLDIAVHTIDGTSQQAAEEIRWPGERSARGLSLTYAADAQYPEPASVTRNCLSLDWDGDTLQWSPAANACDAEYPPQAPTVSVMDNPVLERVTTNFQTLKVEIAMGDLATLAEGAHTWSARAKVTGVCSDATEKSSKESCMSFRHRIVAPPPAVQQPEIQIIPESTYPDRQGNAYFNLDLVPLLAAESNPRLVNIYRIDLEYLHDTISDLVDGNVLLAGQAATLQTLAHESRQRYQRINAEPIEVNATPFYYPVRVEGNIEAYHVLAIVGTNPQLEEIPWEQAAILLFKTPAPAAIPQLVYEAMSSVIKDTHVEVKCAFHADFEQPVTAPLLVPKIQLIRHDLSAGRQRLVGEADGEWDDSKSTYRFNFTDTKAIPWRHYRYEASLLLSSEKHGVKYIKSPQTAMAEILVDGPATPAPLDEGYFTIINPHEEGGWQMSFEFMMGDFELSITKVDKLENRQRYTGRIRQGKLSGLANAILKTENDRGVYLLRWIDPDATPGTYKLRIWRKQMAPWSNGIRTP